MVKFLLKYGPKKSAPECPVECGEVQSLFGQCPNAEDMNAKGYSLTAANSKKRPKNGRKRPEDARKVPFKFDKHLTRPKIEETNCGQRLQLFT